MFEYKEIIRIIKMSSLNNECKKVLIDEIRLIEDEYALNPFFEIDFLKKAILNIVEIDFTYESDLREYLGYLKDYVAYLLPYGEATENYEKIKNMILGNLINNVTYENKDELFDKEFYAFFGNMDDYITIMNLIMEYEYYIDKFYVIKDFVSEILPFRTKEEVLRDTVSFISNLNDDKDYVDKFVSDIKKSYGIYENVDEKNIALISSKIDKFSALSRKIESFEKRMDDYKKSVDIKTKNGLASIDKRSNEVLEEINREISLLKESLESDLDDYQKSLERALSKSSDEAFNKVLESSESRIKEIKDKVESITILSNRELSKLKLASDESLEKLKNYVENDEELRSVLKKAESDQEIKTAILEITKNKSSNQTLIVPNNNVVIPSFENITIIPPFDESISFNERLKSILEKKKKKESEGEIFHKLTEEVVVDVMEGDWVYLYGPSGCGKSFLIKQVADLIGMDLVDNGKITDKYGIMAYNDVNWNFRITQAYLACTEGKLLQLDELDNGNPDTQVVLNTLYSALLDALEKPNIPSYVTFAEDRVVPVNPNFRMISAGNTTGSGENRAYSSRAKMDESVQERMVPIKFDYDNEVEKIIFKDYTAWYGLFTTFRDICTSWARKADLDSPEGITTTRDATAIVKYIKHNSKSIDQIMREKFVQTKSIDYLNFIASSLKQKYNLPNEFSKIESNLSEASEKELAYRLVRACERVKKD